MATTDELASKLHRRVEAIDAADEGRELPTTELPSLKIFNPFTEFKEFSRKEIQHYQKMFNLYVGSTFEQFIGVNSHLNNFEF